VGLVDGIRLADVAVTQVDVVGHSAGGQLARLWAQSGGYRRIENLQAGDFRKLITVGTPHTGSPVAPLVHQLLEAGSISFGVRLVMNIRGTPLDSEVLQDQDPNSDVLENLQSTPVPSRAWIGEVAVLPEDSPERGTWRRLADACRKTTSASVQVCQGINGAQDAEQLRTNVFGTQTNDGLVGSASQAGGLVGARSFLANTTHTEEAGAGEFMLTLPGFLDTSGGLDPGFP